MKGKIPGGIPRIFPLVRHGDHVGIQHVEPFHVPRAVAVGLEQRMTLVLDEPALQIEVVELLAPEHPGQCLAVNPAFIFVE